MLQQLADTARDGSRGEGERASDTQLQAHTCRIDVDAKWKHMETAQSIDITAGEVNALKSGRVQSANGSWLTVKEVQPPFPLGNSTR